MSQVLSGFLLSLTAHPATTSGAGSAAGDAPVQPSAEDAARFVRRYLRWQKYKQAEKDMRLSDVTARSAGAANGHAEAGPSSAAAAAADGAAAAAQGGGGRGVSPAWSLVQRVRRHPSFAKHYSLPSYLRGWKCTRR